MGCVSPSLFEAIHDLPILGTIHGKSFVASIEHHPQWRDVCLRPYFKNVFKDGTRIVPCQRCTDGSFVGAEVEAGPQHHSAVRATTKTVVYVHRVLAVDHQHTLFEDSLMELEAPDRIALFQSKFL